MDLEQIRFNAAEFVRHCAATAEQGLSSVDWPQEFRDAWYGMAITQAISSAFDQRMNDDGRVAAQQWLEAVLQEVAAYCSDDQMSVCVKIVRRTII
jgi:hypothetical protein